MATREIIEIPDSKSGDINDIRDKKIALAKDAASATDITAQCEYLIKNGQTGEFMNVLKSYIDESVRSALGALVNNLDKGSSIKSVLATDSSNDLGSITPANLASVLGYHRTEVWDFKWTSTTSSETTNYTPPFDSAVYIIAYDSNFCRAGLVYINIPENNIEFIGNPYGLSTYFEISINNGGIKILRKGQNVRITLGIKYLI